MYSIKFAAKLLNIKELRNRIVEKLSIFIVLSTYYLTFRLAKERPISWLLSFYLYSWLSGLVKLLFPLFMVLGGHGFRVVDGLF